LTVRCVERETRETIAVTFDVPEGLRERFRFTQGQFLTLRAFVDGEELRRSYSICAAPHEGDLRIAIKRAAAGRFSRWAHETFAPGTPIDIAPPQGRFHVPLAPAACRHYLGFAAGSGITPLLSIVKAVLAGEPRSRFTLVYGNRASSTTMFRRELQALKDRYLARFALVFVMSREPQDIELFSGRIDRAKCDALLEAWIDPATVDVAFLCGPPEMMRAAEGSLRAHGVAAERIKTERFASGPPATERPPIASEEGVEAEICRAYAILDGRRREFTIRKGKETFLDAGLRQGIDLPFSCKGGVCSTCRVLLVEGEVDMDVHYALEDYEIARGFILMCQSYPATSVVGVDADIHA